jgi:uncharacterized protein (DUF305 family)
LPTHVVTRPAPRSGRARAARQILAALVVAAIALFLTSPPAAADEPAEDPDAATFEVEFLEEMINHHAMGVHMAEMCLDKAVHRPLLNLCEDIISAQAAEIELMQEWLADWYGIDHEPVMHDPVHHAQMMELEMLSGEEFEAAFLRMMAEHHVMAVDDSTACLDQAEHRELQSLCSSIIRSQAREIFRMEVWLCAWFGACDFRNPMAA